MREETLDYKVELPLFEGPLDLLLHLVRKNDVEIEEIPIALILDQYLGYLQQARGLNIDLAGEFLELAAELAWIKSKMLLPESEDEKEEGPDPRADLAARLLEYRKYKLAALLTAFQELLKRLPSEQSHEVRRERVGVAERIIELVEKMRGESQMLFERLFEDEKTREEMIVTFLAILEMARQKLIRILQENVSGAIVIQPLILQEGEA
ncbi:MAG: segregation/condensation protein A [Deltaproteobacteria bacterium]|nr:segregation/condensation protein A [Deltaproteobacteria bacterium]